MAARATAAKNPTAPQAVLERLLADGDPRVRTAAAKNPGTPRESVRRFEAECAGVRQRALPDQATLGEMAGHKRAEVRMEVAFSPAADANLLVMLGGERSVQVRRAVAANPRTPDQVSPTLASRGGFSTAEESMRDIVVKIAELVGTLEGEEVDELSMKSDGGQR